jgi:hypothetical protein
MWVIIHFQHIFANTTTLGCKRHSSHKTNHTLALVGVVENNGSTIRVYIHCNKHNARDDYASNLR